MNLLQPLRHRGQRRKRYQPLTVGCHMMQLVTDMAAEIKRTPVPLAHAALP
jgi:hypothetical protein